MSTFHLPSITWTTPESSRARRNGVFTIEQKDGHFILREEVRTPLGTYQQNLLSRHANEDSARKEAKRRYNVMAKNGWALEKNAVFTIKVV